MLFVLWVGLACVILLVLMFAALCYGFYTLVTGVEFVSWFGCFAVTHVCVVGYWWFGWEFVLMVFDLIVDLGTGCFVWFWD